MVPRFRHALLALLLCAAWFAPAHAQGAPEEIAEIIGEAAELCRKKGGNPDTAPILKSDDLNNDGHNDWIVDFSRFQCAGAENPTCNPAGCTLQIYLGTGDEWDLVFEDFVKAYKFSKSGKTHTMHVTTWGIPCNKEASQTCKYNYRIETDAVRPVQ